MFLRLNNDNKILILIIAASLAIKLSIFGYGMIKIPSYKFMPDTPTYVEPGINLVEKGLFGVSGKDGSIKYEVMRTPGYPLFLGFLNKTAGLSFDGIIIIQLLLITFAGYMVYKAACELDKKIALLAAFIFLFDMPVTISALMLLTEALYTVFIAVFIYLFLRYLREQRLYLAILSALVLAAATYIRPISYYLGLCIAAGIVYAFFRTDFKKAAGHALVFLLVFYSCLGIWNYRNYVRTGSADFSSIDNVDFENMGLPHQYVRAINRGEVDPQKTGPAGYYAVQAAKSVANFVGRPGTLKYLKSLPIKVLSKIYGYPWVVFWMIGLFFARYDKLPYLFLLLTVLYFMVTSVVGVGLCAASRFRVPVMPLISILSACGWMVLYSKFRNR